MSATPEVRYWQHVESGHVNMARLGGGPDGVAERDPIWREVTVTPVVAQGAATPAGATWHTDPPPGWSTFGAHAFMDEVPALEFWGEEYGGDGLPIWERPVPAPDADVAERIAEARERAWREYRDGPGYVPTDRYDVRSSFDAAWNAAHPSRPDADVALMRRAAASERAAERHWPADMLAQAADTIERLRTDLAANPDADVTERIGAILREHQPTSGMQVASGVTCRCGYWTGEERPGVTRPVGYSGLVWHQAQVIATPPVASTEAVSGYTSHGHRITGVVQTGRPASVARCGGPGLCAVCSLEASMATNERHG